MYSTLRYRVVDVFTLNPLEGNALAVFPDALDIAEDTMQKIARELNLAETVFILPSSRPGCAARFRIFTPAREMAFAGHPTVGGAYVLLDEQVVPANRESFFVEEQVGPVAVRVESGERPMIWLTTPAIRDGNTYAKELCATALGLGEGDLLDSEPQLLSAGNPTLFIGLRDKRVVDRASLGLEGLRLLKAPNEEPICVFIFTPVANGAYSRMFAPEHGIIEDPATGSATGPLAAYMMRHKLVSSDDGTRFISEQGTAMGRRSLLHVLIRGEHGSKGIDVGGHVTPLVSASMTLPV